ncbi:hypothetical protein A1D22_02565 [Pasteurellaceae bacterium LFhippo2]|nr:hypothetical protein [Pasteurellaceae bacterium LFhippo2]
MPKSNSLKIKMRVHYNNIMNKIHHNFIESENISSGYSVNQIDKFEDFYKLSHALAKSSVQAWKPVYKLTANNSTPFNKRAFFVCGTRTPKENNQLNFEFVAFLSMVGRSGQRLIVGCLPLVTVFHPTTFYRQAWKLAVDSLNLLTEFSAMIYSFLYPISKLRVSVGATSLTDAYARLPKSEVKPVLIARKPSNPTGCKVKGGIYA